MNNNNKKIKALKEEYEKTLEGIREHIDNKKYSKISTEWDTGRWFGRREVVTKIVLDLEELIKMKDVLTKEQINALNTAIIIFKRESLMQKYNRYAKEARRKNTETSIVRLDVYEEIIKDLEELLK